MMVSLRFEVSRTGTLMVDAMAPSDSPRGYRSLWSKDSRIYPGETFPRLADRVRLAAVAFGWGLDESHNDHVNGAGLIECPECLGEGTRDYGNDPGDEWPNVYKCERCHDGSGQIIG